MVQQPKSPFDRVSNGYDPGQVAAFAAEALRWKQALGAIQSDLDAAKKLIDRYESVMGSIETVEREAAEIIDEAEQKAAQIVGQAEREASGIVAMARGGAASAHGQDLGEADEAGPALEPTATPDEVPPEDDDGQSRAPERTENETDSIEAIFEVLTVGEELDPESERERRVAAATANLWKRRGVLAPPQ